MREQKNLKSGLGEKIENHMQYIALDFLYLLPGYSCRNNNNINKKTRCCLYIEI